MEAQSIGPWLGGCVLEDNARAVTAIVVVKVTHDPDTGMIHFHNGGDTLACAKPQNRHVRGIRDRIAIEGHNLEGMAWQRKPANFLGASNQTRQRDPFKVLYAQ